MLWKHTRDWHDAHCKENNFIDVKGNRGIGFLERLGSMQQFRQCNVEMTSYEWVFKGTKKTDSSKVEMRIIIRDNFKETWFSVG